jgi:hypothetical protein
MCTRADSACARPTRAGCEERRVGRTKGKGAHQARTAHAPARAQSYEAQQLTALALGAQVRRLGAQRALQRLLRWRGHLPSAVACIQRVAQLRLLRVPCSQRQRTHHARCASLPLRVRRLQGLMQLRCNCRRAGRRAGGAGSRALRCWHRCVAPLLEPRRVAALQERGAVMTSRTSVHVCGNTFDAYNACLPGPLPCVHVRLTAASSAAAQMHKRQEKRAAVTTHA